MVSRGETNGSAKLYKEDVYVMRSLHSILGLGAAEIARRFQVPRTTVRDILNRKTWSHL